MSSDRTIAGVAAALPIPNLDTDQIMPKQFLRGIDKSGLDRGVFYDLRFDAAGTPRGDFVLNRAGYDACRILVGAENFGCGSSREHAVWGLLQFGIRAVIAPSFGEIFYSNAMNNGLLLIGVSQADVDRFMHDVQAPATNRMSIDLERLQARSATHTAQFSMSARHRQMFMDGLDLIGASLARVAAIAEFERKHWEREPWLQSVAAVVRARVR
ncbi:3-isopropylmalate dehydratase small subunit [Steroidobacter flavus]|uniref:3-isopropylmalate dehydratase small subunit n=1 Tax=Steroidobacter flavus TaxID=1842136 RepID=A0ABV8SXR1_9GAMM